ncbi:MAG: hypothetical protein M3Q10_10795 [Chloroflexota bacterium]|nr:hypothetical protein [Chloroflexota bacterium]
MAVIENRTLRPRLPDLDKLDWRRFCFEFDRRSDTLYWDFSPDAPPAVSYPVSDHLLYSVDPETEEVVGLQFDGFLAHVVHKVPAFLALADEIGLTEADVAEVRRRSDAERERRASMHSILATILPRKVAAGV